MNDVVWLTDKETAARLGIALRTLQNWRASQPDRLPIASNIGRAGGKPLWRFKLSDVEDFVNSRAIRKRTPQGEPQE